ncbi:MAG: TRAP transporter small permease [Candidatus Rokuibacteriota bacterium]
MRALLDSLYRACDVLAAAFLALIAALVVAQVGGRLAGVLVPGADELAGFSLMASSFLALASTLRAGAHIRVTLLIRRAPPARRRPLELWCLGFGAAVTGYFAYHVIEMAWDAYRFGEKSQSVLPIPLWLPQSAMAFGIVVLTLAFGDEFLHVLRRGIPSYPDDLETLEAPTPTARDS